MKRRMIVVLAVIILGCIGLMAAGMTTEEKPAPGSPTTESLGLVLEQGETGINVLGVRRRSPAERGGFSPGDRVLSVDGETILQITQLDEALAGLHPPCSAVFQIERERETQTLIIRLKH